MTERLRTVVEAAQAVGEVHERLINAVTPSHPDFLYTMHGPKGTPEDQEAYEALFSEWHATTRHLRRALAALKEDE